MRRPEDQPINISYRLIPFGADTPPSVQDLTQLHAALLPTSPVSLLGQRFMERFYYTILPREGLICGAVAYVDNHPAGFVVATHDSAGFMRFALRRWWPYLVWVIGTSLIAAPKSITAVWEAYRVIRMRRSAEGSELEGEILSLGILPAYREPRFIQQSGLRISTDLLDHAVSQLCRKGVRLIRAIVGADNTQAKLFYSGLGWTLRRTNVPDWQTPTAEFVWQEGTPEFPNLSPGSASLSLLPGEDEGFGRP